MCREIILQLLVVRRTTFGTTDAVDTNTQTSNAKRAEKLKCEQYTFGIDTCLLCTKYLDAKLVMFAKSTGLGTLIPENGVIQIVHLSRLCFVEQPIFYEHSSNSCGTFRLKRN